MGRRSASATVARNDGPVARALSLWTSTISPACFGAAGPQRLVRASGLSDTGVRVVQGLGTDRVADRGSASLPGHEERSSPGEDRLLQVVDPHAALPAESNLPELVEDRPCRRVDEIVAQWQL